MILYKDTINHLLRKKHRHDLQETIIILHTPPTKQPNIQENIHLPRVAAQVQQPQNKRRRSPCHKPIVTRSTTHKHTLVKNKIDLLTEEYEYNNTEYFCASVTHPISKTIISSYRK